MANGLFALLAPAAFGVAILLVADVFGDIVTWIARWFLD
jgi:ABC-type uncharacterized transport system permease subunit